MTSYQRCTCLVCLVLPLAVSGQTPPCAVQGLGYKDPQVLIPNGGVGIPNVQACQNSCEALVSCKVFTYYVNSGGCWLQGLSGEIPQLVDVEGAWSGPRKCTAEVAGIDVGVVASPQPELSGHDASKVLANNSRTQAGGIAGDASDPEMHKETSSETGKNPEASTKTHSEDPDSEPAWKDVLFAAFSSPLNKNWLPYDRRLVGAFVVTAVVLVAAAVAYRKKRMKCRRSGYTSNTGNKRRTRGTRLQYPEEQRPEDEESKSPLMTQEEKYATVHNHGMTGQVPVGFPLRGQFATMPIFSPIMQFVPFNMQPMLPMTMPTLPAPVREYAYEQMPYAAVPAGITTTGSAYSNLGRF